MYGLLEAMAPATAETALDFGPIILGIVAILGLIGALKGLTRGISRQLIRTITIVASAVISFFAAKGIYTFMSDFLADKTITDIENLLIQYNILSAEADNSWLQNIDIDTIFLVATVPLALLIMPVAFTLCFFFISGVMLIVHVILCAIFGFRKRGNGLISRLLGMALGLIQGVAVAGLLLMPVIGISTMLTDTAEAIRQETSVEEGSSDSLVSLYDDYVKSIAENPATKALGGCGINALYKNIATVEVDERKTDMTALIPDIAKITGKITSLKGIDFKHLTPENEAAITEMFDTVEKNTYLTRVLAGGIKMFSYAYTNGAVGINAEAPVSNLLNSAITIFHTADATNVHGDIDTICEVTFILSREGVLAAFESGSTDMMNALTKRDAGGKTTVNKIIDIIEKNERTKPLIGMLTDLSISVMSQSTGVDENTLAVGNNIKANINDKTMKLNRADFATEEEYVGAVSSSLDESLKENNITLEKEVVDDMAQYIAQNYGDQDELSDDEANDILLYYFDAYVKNEDAKTQN